MSELKKIKVLVVDDSLVFRELITRGISADSEIEVVATAVDTFDARDKIIDFNPDVMTCDLHMPKMNGIEFIRRLLPQHPLPVIIISKTSGAVFDALNAGAVEFLSKPDLTSPQDVEYFINDLITKIKVASRSKIARRKLPTGGGKKLAMKVTENYSDRIIAIGSSTGGTEAVYHILRNLPSGMPPILVVQHIPPVFSRLFAERLNEQTDFTAKEAENGDPAVPGSVLVAPGDRHMRLEKKNGRYMVSILDGEKVNGHCPSVDVLFESVAEAAGEKAVGIILTGMGHDGSRGLMLMRRKGARTIGQDEQSSIVYGMPKAAFEIGAVEKQVPLDKIPQTILEVLSG